MATSSLVYKLSFHLHENIKKKFDCAYDTKSFISLFERAFKLLKNGVYFTRIALLVPELFKILINAN